MANIGDMYTVYRVPIRLYYSSDRAARKDITSAGWIQTAKSYRIEAVYWTNANGDWLQTKPATGGIPLYALQDNPYGTWYGIGWVRDDENYAPTTITDIEQPQDGFLVTLNKIIPDATHTVNLRTEDGYQIGRLTNVTQSSILVPFDRSNEAFYARYPNNNIYNVIGEVDTYKDGQKIGSTQSYKLIVSFNRPASFVTQPQVTIINPRNNNAYIGISQLRVVTNFKAGLGATVDSINIRIGDTTGNGPDYTSPILNQSGNIIVTVTAKDSRGSTATYQTNVFVQDYTAPSIELFVARRTAGNEVYLESRGFFDNVISTNIGFVIEARKNGEATWVTKTQGQATKINNIWEVVETLDGFESTNSYEIRMSINDGIGLNTVAIAEIGTEEVPISWGVRSTGIGKIVDDDASYHLQVGNLGIHTEGSLTIGDVELTEDILRQLIEGLGG